MSGLSGASAFTLDPHFFRYPSLVIYLNLAVLECVRLFLALTGQASSVVAVRALYLSDPTPFYVAARAVTACLGALTVLPVFRIGRMVEGRAVSTVAALLVALNPYLIAKSQMVDVAIPMTLLVTICLAQR